MATSKSSYTPEQTKELIDLWDNGKGEFTIQELAEKLTRSVKSVANKLNREGLYSAPSKTKAASVKKDDLASQISAKCGLDEIEADSLTKANRSALVKVLAALTPKPAEHLQD